LHNGDGVTPLATRECADLVDAVICTTHPMAHFNESERAQFTRVEQACRLSRYGGDCYAYGLIAMGFVDLVMEARLAHWDIAPLIPIVEGAGGILTDWHGQPWRPGGNVLAAGDPSVHAEALLLLGS
jgi:myo-inositol-1(or 4)-monophosphatase